MTKWIAVLVVAVGAVAASSSAEWAKSDRVDEMTSARLTLLQTADAAGSLLSVGCGGKNGRDLLVFVHAADFVPRVVRRRQMRAGLWWTVPALLRFDEGKAEASGFDVDPGKPQILDFERSMFSSNLSRWAEKIEKASRLRVRVEAEDGSSHTLDFDLRGLDASSIKACYR
jgi:hypothetical protein